MGLEGFDPFHTMHYGQSQSAHVKWLEILEGRADDPPPRLYEVLIVEFSGAVYKSGKTGLHIQFSTHLLGVFLHQCVSGWLVCFCRSPGKGRALSKSVPN